MIDADQLVREVQRPGTPTLEAIVRRFGEGVLGRDGDLDREALRAAVLSNEEALSALNAIVHPAVARRRSELVEEARLRGDCILVNDIPLLFEVLDPGDFDLVVLVDAPPELRRERAVRQRGFKPEDADRMMAAQLPSDVKRHRSDIVIDNVGTPGELGRLAWEAWLSIRATAARLSAGVGTTGPLLVILASPRDLVLTMGGTLARYSDADIAVHAVLVSEVPGELAGLLRVQEVTQLARREDEIDPADQGAIEEIAISIRRFCPSVVVTYGPEGMFGRAVERAVHAWVRVALGEAAPRVYYAALPAAEAARIGGRSRGIEVGRLAARLDVRPWRDVKARAWKLLGGSSAAGALTDREWFAAPTIPERPLADLFASAPDDG